MERWAAGLLIGFCVWCVVYMSIELYGCLNFYPTYDACWQSVDMMELAREGR
jgi:hypothetical protein